MSGWEEGSLLNLRGVLGSKCWGVRGMRLMTWRQERNVRGWKREGLDQHLGVLATRVVVVFLLGGKGEEGEEWLRLANTRSRKWRIVVVVVEVYMK